MRRYLRVCPCSLCICKKNPLTSRHLSELLMGQNLLSLVGSGCQDGENGPSLAEQKNTLITSIISELFCWIKVGVLKKCKCFIIIVRTSSDTGCPGTTWSQMVQASVPGPSWAPPWGGFHLWALKTSPVSHYQSVYALKPTDASLVDQTTPWCFVIVTEVHIVTQYLFIINGLTVSPK